MFMFNTLIKCYKMVRAEFRLGNIVLRAIGNGIEGIAFLGKHDETSEEYVVKLHGNTMEGEIENVAQKMLIDAKIECAMELPKCASEIAMHMNLVFPGFSKVYSKYAGKTLTMEYSVLSREQRVKIFDTILKFVLDLANRGYIHHDIHGGNILIYGNKITICDYSSFKRVGEEIFDQENRLWNPVEYRTPGKNFATVFGELWRVGQMIEHHDIVLFREIYAHLRNLDENERLKFATERVEMIRKRPRT